MTEPQYEAEQPIQDGSEFEPIPIPEKLTRTWTDETWAGLAPDQQRRIATSEDEKMKSSEQARARVSSTMGNMAQRIESLEAKLTGNGQSNGAASSNVSSNGNSANAWGDLNDAEFDSQSRNVLDWYDRKIANPDDEEVQKTASSITSSTVAAIHRENARREVARAVSGLRDEGKQAAAASQHASALVAKLIPLVGQNALNDPNNPVHKRKDELYAEYVDANGGEASAALEYAAWRAAHAELDDNAKRGGGGSPPRHLEIGGFASARNASTTEDPQVSALRRQGKRREASDLRLRKMFDSDKVPSVPRIS